MWDHRTVTGQKERYFLKQWLYFETEYEYLSEVERTKMKILFTALKGMSEEDRAFLAAKYKITKQDVKEQKWKGYITDSNMAASYGMNVKDYKEKRLKIEGKFSRLLIEANGKYREEKDACLSGMAAGGRR